MQDVTNPVSLLFMQDIPVLLDSMQFFFTSCTFGATDLLHLPSTTHFRTSQVFPIYFPKCPSFSTVQR